MFLEKLFSGIFDTNLTANISLGDFLLCLLVSLAAGGILAACYVYRTRYTKSFVATLAMLPGVVCVVILMVNGNIGAGVAVAGTFSLVRFRSVPGTAKEIGAIFMAMATGLVIGMGYLAYGVLIALVFGAVSLVLSHFSLGAKRGNALYRTLRIVVPEDLNDMGVFDDILEEYTRDFDLIQVKTVHMGSLYRLTYHIVLKDAKKAKEMMDKIRCRNGNLELTLSQRENAGAEL